MDGAVGTLDPTALDAVRVEVAEELTESRDDGPTGTAHAQPYGEAVAAMLGAPALRTAVEHVLGPAGEARECALRAPNPRYGRAADGVRRVRRGIRTAVGREFSDPAYSAVHRLTVAAHRLQHPDDTSAHSVAVHLAALHGAVTLGLDPTRNGRRVRRVRAGSQRTAANAARELRTAAWSVCARTWVR